MKNIARKNGLFEGHFLKHIVLDKGPYLGFFRAIVKSSI
jgi:hypothetical protein